MYLNAWRLTERQDLCMYPSILASTHPPPQPQHPLLHLGRKYLIPPPTEMFPRQSSPLWPLICPLGPFTTVVLVFLHVRSSPTLHEAAVIRFVRATNLNMALLFSSLQQFPCTLGEWCYSVVPVLSWGHPQVILLYPPFHSWLALLSDGFQNPLPPVFNSHFSLILCLSMLHHLALTGG